MLCSWSACSKQPKCSGQTRSDAAAAAETTDALAVALTVVSGRYSTGFFTSDKLSVVSAAAADDGAVYLWGRNFQNEVESNWFVRYNAGWDVGGIQAFTFQRRLYHIVGCIGGRGILSRTGRRGGRKRCRVFAHACRRRKRLTGQIAGNDLENLIGLRGACLSDGRENALYLQPAGGKGSADCRIRKTEITIAFLRHGRNRRRLLRRYRQPSTSWKQTARSLRKPERFRFCFAAASSCPARIQATIVWCSGKRSCSGGTSNKLPPRSCFPLIPTAWFPTTSVRLRVSETAPFWARLGKAGSCRIGCSGWNRLRKRQNREANEF